MNIQDMTKAIRDIAATRGIAIDEGPSFCGVPPSEGIAGFILNDLEKTNEYIHIKRAMAQIDAMLENENIGIMFTAKMARRESDAEIPLECFSAGDLNAVRKSIIEGLYNSIKQRIFNLPDVEIRDYMKGGRLYHHARLWERAKNLVDKRIENDKQFNKWIERRQKNAVNYIWDLAPKEGTTKTNIVAFIYDILLAGGLIQDTEDARIRTDEEKRQYIKNYLPR